METLVEDYIYFTFLDDTGDLVYKVKDKDTDIDENSGAYCYNNHEILAFYTSAGECVKNGAVYY